MSLNTSARWLSRTVVALLVGATIPVALILPPAHAASGCTLAKTTTTTSTSLPTRSGSTFTYAYYMPITTTGTLPLVVSLHGSGANGASTSNSTKWAIYASHQTAGGGSGPYDTGKPFLAIFPQDNASPTTWTYASNTDKDVTVVVDAINDAIGTGCVDTSKIFVDGWSAGAFLSQRLACFDAGGAAFDIAKIAEYAGGDPEGGLIPGGPCTPMTRHTPLLMIHDDPNGNTQDAVVSTKSGYASYVKWVTSRYTDSSNHPVCVKDSNVDDEFHFHAAVCSDGTPLLWVPAPNLDHLLWSCRDPSTLQADERHDQMEWNFFINGTLPTAIFTC